MNIASGSILDTLNFCVVFKTNRFPNTFARQVAPKCRTGELGRGRGEYYVLPPCNSLLVIVLVIVVVGSSVRWGGLHALRPRGLGGLQHPGFSLDQCGLLLCFGICSPKLGTSRFDKPQALLFCCGAKKLRSSKPKQSRVQDQRGCLEYMHFWFHRSNYKLTMQC